jgi:hypothetical protein
MLLRELPAAGRRWRNSLGLPISGPEQVPAWKGGERTASSRSKTCLASFRAARI